MGSKDLILRRTPIRRTPIRKPPIRKPRKKKDVRVGKHTGKVRLFGKALAELKRAVYERAEGWCEIRGI